MVQLADGRLLSVGQKRFRGEVINGVKIEDGYYIQLLTSSNGGGSWQDAGTISFQTFGNDVSNVFEDYGEPFILKAANGDLLVFLRTGLHSKTGEKKGKKYPPVKVTRSTDNGKTWSKPVEVHKRGVMPVATLLDNGIIVAFTGRGGNRVAASRDNGLTWHCQHNVMSTAQSPNFSGHNTLVPVGGGRVLLIYGHNHSHPDNHKDPNKVTAPAADNKYGAELIGTFVSFTEDVR